MTLLKVFLRELLKGRWFRLLLMCMILLLVYWPSRFATTMIVSCTFLKEADRAKQWHILLLLLLLLVNYRLARIDCSRLFTLLGWLYDLICRRRCRLRGFFEQILAHVLLFCLLNISLLLFIFLLVCRLFNKNLTLSLILAYTDCDRL